MVEEAFFLRGTTIKWAGIVADGVADDQAFVMQFTDGASAKVVAWQREGYEVEMDVKDTAS